MNAGVHEEWHLVGLHLHQRGFLTASLRLAAEA
jgi:hypothetical protein